MTVSQIDHLLVQISEGDNDAFEELYIGTRRGVFSFLYTYYRRMEDAEDCMQTVYLKIKKYIHTYKPGTNGRAWILQIAKNTALTDIKRRSLIDYGDMSEDLPAEDSDVLKRMYITETVRRTLNTEEQQIISLHILGGYRHKEIAIALDLPIGTVCSKYRRALQKLKQALKEEER